MKLSVITVNLNNVEGLRKTAESIVSQTYKDFEWIVIDGGSIDGSKELLEQYSSHLSFWVSEPDNGIYNAMNKGVAHAKGEYCQFLNSGDWLVGNTVLEDVFSEQYAKDIIYCDIDFYKDGIFSSHGNFPEMLSVESFIDGSLGHNSCFIKRKLLEATPYDENLKIVSDWKFFMQMFLDGKSFGHLNVCVGCFDMNGVSEVMRELRESERKSTRDHFSSLLLESTIKDIKSAETHLSRTTLCEFSRLCENHRFLSKIITALTCLMKTMD